jgi:hypothetical protein
LFIRTIFLRDPLINSNNQIPNNNQSPNDNDQIIANESITNLDIGDWNLFGYWCLPCTILGAGLDIWKFC